MKNRFIKLYKKYDQYFYIFLAVTISVLIFIFRNKFVHLQGLGYLGIFLISIIGNATVVLPVPAMLTTFIGGSMLNPLLVAVASAFGATIGEMTGYIGGLGGGEILQNNKRIKKIKKWMDKYGLWTLFFLAAIPNPIFDLAGIVAGASRIPVGKYLIVVWFGKLIKFIIVAYAGFGIQKAVF